MTGSKQSGESANLRTCGSAPYEKDARRQGTSTHIGRETRDGNSAQLIQDGSQRRRATCAMPKCQAPPALARPSRRPACDYGRQFITPHRFISRIRRPQGRSHKYYESTTTIHKLQPLAPTYPQTHPSPLDFLRTLTMASTEEAAQKLYDDPETGEKISKSECTSQSNATYTLPQWF